MVRDAGVVGAGGAGFPTHVKLKEPVRYLILNAAECEPLLRVDQQLCVRHGERIVVLMALLSECLSVERAIIALKKKHVSAVAALEKYCSGVNVSVFPLEDFYPAGDEQVLVAEVIGESVPENGIPMALGCVVINVETLLNIGDALEGKPVTETCVTVSGNVPEPGTFWLPIGISYREALSEAGVTAFDGMAVLDGGPMMGRIIRDFTQPITKTTKGILLFQEDHPIIRKKSIAVDQARRVARTACEQCRMCTDLCPRYALGHNMQPHKMMRKIAYSYERLEDATIAQLCCECNLCELYACPVNLPPKTVNVLYKEKLAHKGIRHVPNLVPELRAMRQYRKTPVPRLIARIGLSQYDQDAPLRTLAAAPLNVRILMGQHIGVPAVPVVSCGESVVKGQLLGEIPRGALGARVHASISGTVIEANDVSVTISAN